MSKKHHYYDNDDDDSGGGVGDDLTMTTMGPGYTYGHVIVGAKTVILMI